MHRLYTWKTQISISRKSRKWLVDALNQLADKIVQGLTARLSSYFLSSMETFVATISTSQSMERICELIQWGLDDGARISHDGRGAVVLVKHYP